MKITMRLLGLFFGVLMLGNVAYAQTPREELRQMVEQLQSSPNDNALREKIIKLAQGVKPRPVIPEEANRAFVKGNIFKEAAKDASGYELAISAYREALRAAPWWGDAYFNLAVTLMLAEKFDEAIASLTLYMASVPTGSAEARDAQNRIYAIEAKSEMASRQAVAQAAAERERQRPSVEGRWTEHHGVMSFQVVRNGERFTIIGGDMLGVKSPSTWRAPNLVADRQHLRFKGEHDNSGVHMYTFDLSLTPSGNELTGRSLENDRPVTFTRVP